MKKIITLILLGIMVTPSFACDLCGCANGSSFVGLLPRSGSQFLGLRYRQRSFDSHLNSKLLKTREDFQTAELWGRFYPIKKMQLLFFIPMNVNEQTSLYSGSKVQKKGLGDITLIAHYNVFNTLFDSTKTSQVYHNLLIGGGVKLPTGKFDYGYSDVEINPNFQLGTGSTDFLLNAIHTMRYKGVGLNTEAGGRIAGKSHTSYRFGNKINASITAFYTKTGGVFTIMPNLGTSYDYGFKDKKEGVKNSQTGGYSLMTNAGLQTFYKKNSIGLTYSLPISQNLGGGELKVNPQFSMLVTIGL